MDGARYDVMLAGMDVPVYHFERWLLCVVRLDYTPKNPLIKRFSMEPKASIPPNKEHPVLCSYLTSFPCSYLSGGGLASLALRLQARENS